LISPRGTIYGIAKVEQGKTAGSFNSLFRKRGEKADNSFVKKRIVGKAKGCRKKPARMNITQAANCIQPR